MSTLKRKAIQGQENLREIKNLLQWFKIYGDDIEKLGDLVQNNHDFFRATPGVSVYKTIYDYLVPRINAEKELKKNYR